ncbi:hypothetical protein [Pseudomonas paracarnis]|uniref:hypothetical protein n=1 Tax=Pseudomonas paracarnis TaxID=2750625 RepID=UPI00249B6D8B|nr:hypothetical protein [Pseudomonas paracarnis]MDI3184681.1 hypothetical protein [Pseudomonas paracarnis]
MSIIRAPRPEANFYILSKSISEDARLSWAARGLLVFLLGKPDHWAVSVTHLRNETSKSSKPTGRDGVYGLLQELITAGYVQRRQDRLGSGLLGETHYFVSESPLPALPDTAAPLPAQPYPANPTLVSIEGEQGLKQQARTEKPSGAKAPSRTKAAKFDPVTAKPESVSNQTWQDWCQHRAEIKRPLTATTCAKQAKTLAGHHDADAVINQSISNGWTGLFPDKVVPGGKTVSNGPDFYDQSWRTDTSDDL